MVAIYANKLIQLHPIGSAKAQKSGVRSQESGDRIVNSSFSPLR